MGTSFHMQNFAFNNKYINPVRIDSNIWSPILLENNIFCLEYNSLFGRFRGIIYFQFCSRA